MGAAAAAIPYIGPAASLIQNILNFQNDGRAAKSISDANIAAEHGVLGASQTGQAGVTDAAKMGIQGVESAVGSGQGGVTDALRNGTASLNAAGGQAIGTVNDATKTANAGLTDMLGGQVDKINPFLEAGNTGLTNIAKMAGDKFSFNYNDYANDPAFQFQMDAANKAIQNSGSARGLGSSGAIMQELQKSATGLAATHYGEAFNRAKDAYGLNASTGLAENQALLGAGVNGLNQYNNVTSNAGGQIAANTIGAGKYEGDTTQSIAGLLAKMGIDANEFNANLGLKGALANSDTGLDAAKTNSATGLKASGMAGDYAVGAGTAHAGGILGQGSDVNSGLDSIAGLLKKILGGGN
jgi:hypothetical protein